MESLTSKSVLSSQWECKQITKKTKTHEKSMTAEPPSFGAQAFQRSLAAGKPGDSFVEQGQMTWVAP